MAAEMTAGVWLVAIYLLIPVCLYVFAPRGPSPEELNRRARAIVLVLGDLGRSPRMMYHARSLARGNVEVNLCGYDEGSQIIPEIANSPIVSIHRLPVIKNEGGLPFILFAIKKVILQHYYLLSLLWKLRGAEYLLVQNPPSIPTLGVAKIFIIFMSRRTKLLIDWHNLGYSILGLKLGHNHILVRVYEWYEQLFGNKAYCHFTVTVRMGQVLKKKFGMRARRIIPLYDRPASNFNPLDDNEQRAVIQQQKDTIFKDLKKNEKIVITSTSYTPDENLYTLLSALKAYDYEVSKTQKSANAQIQRQFPPLRVIVTGKGPMYDEMKEAIERQKMDNVTIHQVWLSIDDYPKVLGTADLGVSLHESSSGWDLPMKVVDMFGCGVPVIAIGFPALPELVKEGVNGLIVDDSEGLADALKLVFSDHALLKTLKNGAIRESRLKWDSNWLTKVGPLFGVGEYAQRPNGYISESSSSDSDSDDGF